MVSDPASLLLISLVVVAANILVLIWLRAAGRPVALLISAGAFVFCLQQAFSASQSQQINTLLQALGSAAFFSLFQFSILHQMLPGPKETEKSQ